MKIFIADKYPEAHLERFKQLGCTVTYNPTVKAEDLPKLISGEIRVKDAERFLKMRGQ